MNALIIDATDTKLAVVVLSSDRIFSHVDDESSRRHTSTIMPTISQLLKEAQITVDDLDVIASVVGPGSFTGIRIGVATANALASVGSKRVEMTSLEIELIDTTSGVALLNSKLNHFYGARKQDSSIEYFEINRSDLDRFENARYKTAFNLEKTITTFYQKYNNKIFVPQIIPFYVGKSSADK